MKIGIIGYGEIGSSLYKVYSEFSNYDIKVLDPFVGKNEDLTHSEFLNICIPYTEKFVDVVNDYVVKYSPKNVIIHSTVAPGTTKKIIGKVSHSPVRGVHPNLDIGIKTFVKFIGSENVADAEEYARHLSSMNIKSIICKNSLTTEYAKLLDTTYYGICIAFHSDVLELCEREQLNFEEVMTQFNKTYNEGYIKLGKENVVRPVLYGTKKIGGHCVIPNAEILENYITSDLITGLLKYK